MLYSTKSSLIPVVWGATSALELTLESTAQTSNVIPCPFAKRATLYVDYKAGASETGNTADFTIEVNPLDAESDPTGLYWSTLGIYTDSTGTWSQEKATYAVAQGTGGSYAMGVPIKITNLDAMQIRFTAKESGVASNKGSVKCFLVKNEIT